jgi:hypothetical protein
VLQFENFFCLRLESLLHSLVICEVSRVHLIKIRPCVHTVIKLIFQGFLDILIDFSVLWHVSDLLVQVLVQKFEEISVFVI